MCVNFLFNFKYLYMQHNGEINQISVDEEGEFLATAADDGKVLLEISLQCTPLL